MLAFITVIASIFISLKDCFEVITVRNDGSGHRKFHVAVIARNEVTRQSFKFCNSIDMLKFDLVFIEKRVYPNLSELGNQARPKSFCAKARALIL